MEIKDHGRVPATLRHVPVAGDTVYLLGSYRIGQLFPSELTLNIMTLSGLTVAIGRVVDDSIVVMDQARVVDQGTHDALLARGGIYADLHRLQFTQSEDETNE